MSQCRLANERGHGQPGFLGTPLDNGRFIRIEPNRHDAEQPSSEDPQAQQPAEVTASPDRVRPVCKLAA